MRPLSSGVAHLAPGEPATNEFRIAEPTSPSHSRGRGRGRGRRGRPDPSHGRPNGRNRNAHNSMPSSSAPVLANGASERGNRGREARRGRGRGRHDQPSSHRGSAVLDAPNPSSEPGTSQAGVSKVDHAPSRPNGRRQNFDARNQAREPGPSQAGASGADPSSTRQNGRRQSFDARNPTREPGPSQAGASGADHAPPRQNGRRQNFGAKLTGPATKADGSTPQEQATVKRATTQNAPSFNLASEDLSLSARLTLELSTSAYECLICFSTVTPHQPIYHCPKCFVVFHLRCSSEWASRSVVDTSTRARLLRDRDGIACSEDAARGFWRCPGCQGRQIGEESVPTTYHCWCGKVEHPKRNSRRRLEDGRPSPSVPHGCGMICGKVIAEGCVHKCPLECHPGSCPACAAVIETPCHCHKTRKTVRCSQLNPIQRQLNPINDSLLSCGQPCGRRLSCGLHFCDQPCHPGDCGDCEAIREKSCYCRAVVMPNEKCSSPITPTTLIATTPQTCNLPDGSEWLGEFSCKAPCPWNFDCAVHSCPSTCHPHLFSDSTICPFSPAVLKTCPCGTTPLLTRSACTDPIATCSNPCLKLIPSCGHVCRQTCHTGSCACKELITTPCRCGRDSIIRPCTEIESIRQAAIEAASDEPDQKLDLIAIGAQAVEYRCERLCRVVRHCGKHTCNRSCCPLAFLEGVMKTGKNKKTQSARQLEEEDPQGIHQCSLICKKKLNCGLHVCQLRDHRGPCPSCLQANFDEVTCHCGATVIQPPVPCGTILNCDQPCQRPPLPCGHPKAPHQCHEGECPPCPFLTNKPCMCDKKNVIRNVRCSQPKVTCGQICGIPLRCGAHRCRKPCHAPGECEDCDQLCSKPRKHCGHGCQFKCHAPSACSTEDPCETLIDVKCQCGHITQKVQCSSCDHRPGGNRDRMLKCNNDCVIFQRNLALACAFGDSEATSKDSEVDIEWEKNEDLIQFCLQNPAFVKTVEGQLQNFLKANPPKASYLFPPQNHAKRQFTCELAEVYGLSCECLDQEPRRSVKVTRQPTSRIPRVLLSQAFESTQLTTMTSSNRVPLLKTDLISLPSRETRPRESETILFQGVFGHDATSLRNLIRPAVGTDGFELTWIKDEDVLLQTSRPRLTSSGEGWLTTERKDLRLVTIFTSLKALLGKVPFCNEIAVVQTNEEGQVLERKLDGWRSVGSTEGPRNQWDARLSTISLSNSFGALSLTQQQNQMQHTAREKQKWVAGGVLGGGFNRPPTAVLAPVASTSRHEKSELEEVADDWEDTVV